MMNNETFTLYMLLFSTGILLAAASIAILRFQKKTLESEAFWNSLTGTAMRDRETAAANKRDKDLELRLAALQRVVDELASRQKSAEPVMQTQALPFENAVRMAKKGASVEDLTRSCGLNAGEAQLIWRMHGRHAA
jgi:hypothetical protein